MASVTGARVCRLCGSSKVIHWGAKPGRLKPDVIFDFFRCLACDFRFVEPVTGPEVYDNAYYEGRGADPLIDYAAEYEDYASTPRVEEFRALTKLVTGEFARRLAGPAGPSLQWLDFGCGAGGLLKWLRDHGPIDVGGRLVPIDPSGSDVGTYADRLREHDGFAIHTEADLGAMPEGRFDVISLIEVIEHVERPLEVLELCSRLLRAGGLLLLTTGNLDSPLARRQGLGFGYCVPEIHVSLWTPRCLEVAYQRVGLEAHRVRCEGSIRFKIQKNLARMPALKRFGFLWRSRPVVAALDWLFGVSQMPMAVKR